MKTIKVLTALVLIAVLVMSLSANVFAAPTWGGQNQSQSTSIYEGTFSYRVGRDGTVTVTKCLPVASGAVVIPAEIDGALVTSIGDYAFQHCVKITSIELPSTITNIGYSAFYGCLKLESINIPDSVTKIEYGAFYNCKALKKAEIADLASWCNASLDGPYATPAHILGTLTVNGKDLVDVTIPAYVTSIGDYAFYGCKNMTSVNIHDGVTEIGECAFYGCTALTEMSVSASVTEIGEGAFSGCNGIKQIKIADGNKHYRSIEGCLVEVDSKTLIRGFESGKIPSDGSVTRIGEYAFSGCEQMSAVVIPDTVTVLGAAAFEYCKGLTSVTLSKSLTFINANAFNGCEKLAEIVLPEGITRIGISAFRDCKQLKNVKLPTTLKQINGFAFANCVSLVEIDIPKAVDDIAEGVFSGCSALVNFKFSEGVSRYYSHQGRGYLIDIYESTLIRGSKVCDLIEELGVTKIGQYAFAGCNDMEVIGIPSTVTAIDLSAFEGCDALKTVYYGGQKENWDKIKVSVGNDLLKNVEFVYGSCEAPVPSVEEVTDGAVVEDNDDNGSKADNSAILWIVIAAVGVLIVAGAVVLVIKKFKKK